MRVHADHVGQLCRTGTSVPATFVFAGVFAESDPYDTGNFVPGKNPIPDGLEQHRVFVAWTVPDL